MRLAPFMTGLAVAAAMAVVVGAPAHAQSQTNQKTQTKNVADMVTVQQDDTLDGIATAHQTTYVRMFDANSKIQSPPSNDLSFMLWYFPAKKPTNTLSPGADVQTVLSVNSITINNSRTKVNLVSYRDQYATDISQISDIGLSSQKYSAGDKFTSINGVASPKNPSYTFSMFASLAEPNSQSIQSHTPAEYQSNPEYADLMKIFKSVTYN